jgi:hypothetical protein
MPFGATCTSGWFELKAKGKLPDKRSYNSTVVYDGKLFIYGGEDIMEGRYSDLQFLNLDNFINNESTELEDHELIEAEKDKRFSWQKIDYKGDAPGPLAHHKACIYA